MTEILKPFAVVLLGLLGAGFLSGYETGIYCLNRYRLRIRAARGERPAMQVQRLLTRPHHLIASILLGTNVCIYLATAVVTAFLNAGPATALFLPLVLGFNTVAPHYLYWWSLSLGVLAGSSATLTGATAGTVASSMLKDFTNGKSDGLSFRNYARLGVPIALIFLVVSSIYVILIYSYV